MEDFQNSSLTWKGMTDAVGGTRRLAMLRINGKDALDGRKISQDRKKIFTGR